MPIIFLRPCMSLTVFQLLAAFTLQDQDCNQSVMTISFFMTIILVWQEAIEQIWLYRYNKGLSYQYNKGLLYRHNKGLSYWYNMGPSYRYDKVISYWYDKGLLHQYNCTNTIFVLCGLKVLAWYSDSSPSKPRRGAFSSCWVMLEKLFTAKGSCQ